MSQWIKIGEQDIPYKTYLQITDGERVTIGIFENKKWKDILYNCKFIPTHWQHLSKMPE